MDTDMNTPLEAPLVAKPSSGFATRSKPEKKRVCVNCGKCCNFEASGHQPFITMVDVRNWLNKGLWHVLKRIKFTLGKDYEGKKEARQEWTFQVDSTGTCVFRMNGRCAIHSVAPLACRVYPVENSCRNGTLPQNQNKHDLREFLQAHKEWKRATDGWRQEKLKEILDECVRRGLQVTNPNEKAVPLHDPAMLLKHRF